MKVLLIQVDVSHLSEDELEELEESMLSHIDNFDADLINTGVKEIKDEEDDDRDPIH